MLKVEVLTDIFDERLGAEWSSLLEDAAWATPFQTPAWQRAWWRHFGRFHEPHIVAARGGHDLVGLFPLDRSNGLWRCLRAIGTGQSDYLHPLVRRGFEARFQESLVRHVRSLGDVDLLDLHQVREDAGLDLECATQIEQAVCLTLDLPGDYEEYLSGLSKSLRFDCRRLDKKPFATGEAKIEETTPERTRDALEAFFALHGQRWRKRGLPGAFATRRLRDFHREAAQSLAEAGHLRMKVMSVGGDPAGVIYCMQVGGTRFFYQCGFDPRQKALSPGTLLVASSLLSAIDEGCTVFDFLRGDEPYKRRWNPQHSRRNMRYILPLSPGLGSVGHSFNYATSKIEAKVRARLEGRGLLG